MSCSDNSVAKALTWLEISTNLIYSESVCACSIMPNSLRPHGLYPARILSMEFSRQEYWSGLPFPSPGDLPTDWTSVSGHLLHRHMWRPYKSEDETEVTVTLNLHKGHEGNLGGDKAVAYLNCDASYMTAFCQNSELNFTPKFSQLSIKLLIFSQILYKQRSICILYSYFYTTVIKYPRKMDPIWNIVQTENY